MKKKMVLILTIILTICTAVPVCASVSDYKSQLNDREISIYNGLKQHFYTEKDTSEYVIQWNLTSDTLNSISLQYELDNNTKMAYSALASDCPRFYWAKTINITYNGFNRYIGGVFQYSQITDNTITIEGTTPHGKKARKKFNKAIKRAIWQINKSVGKKAGRVKKLKAINRWICENTKYDSTNAYNDASEYEYLHNAYGVFVSKKAVCDGYAAAFKILCDYYDIPCMISRGYTYASDGSLNTHVWNIVKVKKKWYVVDSTWNDTNNSTKWLLCGKKTIKSTHKSSRAALDVSGSGYFKLPSVSKKDYK